MKTIQVYGASDDLIEVEGDISEEYGALGSGILKIVAQPEDRQIEVDGQKGTFFPDVEEGLYVNAVYGLPGTECGCWGFSVHQLCEDLPLPAWDIKLLPAKAYSAVLEMTLPAGTVITLVGAEEDED